MTRWVLHVDLDQFLAAVEVLRHPELRGRPVVVGGDGDPSKRGVVSTASYEARELGVHSGVPLRTAARRAPDAVFLPVDRPVYEEVSAQVMEVLTGFDAVVQVLGWDEAFMEPRSGDPRDVAREVQERVRERTGLECTVGIGNNRLQAKLATGFGKPAGVFTLTDATWFPVMGDRPTHALWGIGSRTARKLEELGIRTVRDLAVADRQVLVARFGPMNGPWLVALARGRDSTPVVSTPYVARSRSRETTFQRDLTDWDEVRREVEVLAARVTDDVRAEGRPAHRVVVKVRTSGFVTRTHGAVLPAPSDDGEAIARAASTALDGLATERPVRLLGVRAELVDDAPPNG